MKRTPNQLASAQEFGKHTCVITDPTRQFDVKSTEFSVHDDVNSVENEAPDKSIGQTRDKAHSE